MADINERVRPPRAGTGAPAAPRTVERDAHDVPDPALLGLAELLFFAYRDFTREPDKILDEFGFGRAHHRVLHFVNRHPGMRVADLLDILKITKQSLGRVLKQLVDEGFIAQEAGKTDRRERLLHPTPRGRELAERLAAPQLKRIARALEAGGEDTRACVSAFLHHMIGEDDRTFVTELLNAGAAHDPSRGKQT